MDRVHKALMKIIIYQLEINLLVLPLDSQMSDLMIKSQTERVHWNFLRDPDLTVN